MARYELIQLIPSGDVLALKHLDDGRTFCTPPLHHSEHDLSLDDFNYDEEFASYDLDGETIQPYDGAYTVLRTA